MKIDAEILEPILAYGFTDSALGDAFDLAVVAGLLNVCCHA